MRYRLYQASDFEFLYAVEEICFEPPFRFSRAYMRQLIGNPHSATWVAEEGDQLIGFAIVEWAPPPSALVAYLQTLEVVPDRRGQGIGSELLRHVEESARAANAGSIWLHVDSENPAAIHLYQSHGYVGRGREEHYYARNRPALVYAKPLKRSRA